jgi:hypothetical protein
MVAGTAAVPAATGATKARRLAGGLPDPAPMIPTSAF